MKKENIKIELEWVRGHDGLKIERVCRQSYKLYACTLKTVVLVLSALLTIFNLFLLTISKPSALSLLFLPHKVTHNL